MIALYRGVSLVSRLIRWRTWSCYSHASWIMDDGRVIEAWTDGVQIRDNIHDGHTPGTRVDLFDVYADSPVVAIIKPRIESFLMSQLGKGYDWRGVGRFITRRDGNNQRRWFCSELIAAAFNAAQFPLLRNIPAWRIYPGLLAYSPYVVQAGKMKIGSDTVYDLGEPTE